MIAFTDNWLARFRERVNADPEMAVIGDWFTTAFSLSCGERRCIVRFEKGKLVEVPEPGARAALSRLLRDADARSRIRPRRRHARGDAERARAAPRDERP